MAAIPQTIPQLQIPQYKPSQLGSFTLDATAGYGGLTNWLSKYYKQYQQQLQPLYKQQTGWLQRLGQTIVGRPSAAKLWEEQQKKYGVPQMWEQLQGRLTELDAWRQQLIGVQTEEQQRLLEARQMMAPTVSIRGEEALIQREYDIRKAGLSAQISAGAAMIEAVRGNMDMARQFSEQYVQAVTFDYTQRVNDIQSFLAVNADIIGRLEAKEQNFLNQMLDVTKTRLAEQAANARAAMGLAFQREQFAEQKGEALAVSKEREERITYWSKKLAGAKTDEERAKIFNQMAQAIPQQDLSRILMAEDVLKAAIKEPTKITPTRMPFYAQPPGYYAGGFFGQRGYEWKTVGYGFKELFKKIPKFFGL